MFTYSINIARHNHRTGRAHHFALVQLDRGINEESAREDFIEFTQRFPAMDGYSLTLRKHPTESYEQIAYSEGA